MAHDFKVGDIVECIDDDGTQYVQRGKRYEITAAGPTSVAVRGMTGFHLATRFTPITVTVPGYVEEFTAHPDIEGRLMAAWLEVPANCCRACSAPLPCAYHPNG